MVGRWFAKRFPRRLAGATAADLVRMARNPSYRAAHPAELLTPDPFTPPGPPPMSAAARDLLDAVLADPDADAPRLRFADWCDRQGDPRGEFIRAQIDAFHRGGHREEDGEERFNPISAPSAVKQVLQWLAPWSARDVAFRRGFAEAMSLAGRAFISISDGLFRTTPVRDVRLVAVQPFPDELAGCANLAKLDRLDLTGNRIGGDGVRALAGSPHVSRLRCLVLRANDLDDAAVAGLERGAFPGLRSLDVSDNPLTTAGVAMLRERFGNVLVEAAS